MAPDFPRGDLDHDVPALRAPDATATVVIPGPVPAARVAPAATDLRDETPRRRREAYLLARALAGDDIAWSRIVDDHAEAVWTAIVLCGMTRADARHVWQQTWLALSQCDPQERMAGGLRRWLLVTVSFEVSRLRLAQRLNRGHAARFDRSVTPFAPTGESRC
jgi:hypothetical protein